MRYLFYPRMRYYIFLPNPRPYSTADIDDSIHECTIVQELHGHSTPSITSSKDKILQIPLMMKAETSVLSCPLQPVHTDQPNRLMWMSIIRNFFVTPYPLP